MAKNSKCGFITHVKGASGVKGHSGFVDAVEFAKKQSKPTGVLSVCGGTVKRLALCANGSCGGSTSGLGRVGRVGRVGRTRRARRKATKGKRARRRG